MTGPATTLRDLAARMGSKTPRTLLRHLATLDAAPASVQDRLGAAVAHALPAVAPLMPRWDGPLCPAYPLAPLALQARLALGERPDQVMRGLTPREAHEALSRGNTTAIEYVLRDVYAASPRTMPVARWLADAWADPPRRAALETRREHHGPGGAVIAGRLIDRIDEIRPIDIGDGGVKAGVQGVYERASRRAYAEWSDQHATDETRLASVPSWWRPIRCARLLDSRAALIAEGKIQRHCVGGYAETVRSGSSVVLSIAILSRGEMHRSTVELDRSTRTVRQHRGVGNGTPPELCCRALTVILRRIGGTPCGPRR